MAGPSQAVVKMSKVIKHRVLLSKPLVERAGYSIEAFERVCLNMLLAFPAIAACDEESVKRSIMTCVELGLVPDGRECAIVPFGQTATVMPMIKGRLKLARHATPGLALRVRVVYHDDHFVHEEGLDASLEHRPDPAAARDAESVIAAYAVANLPGAEVPEFEVLYRADLDRYRRRSAAVKAGRKGPWDTDYSEMCKKSVLGQLLKRLPEMPGMPDPDDPTTDVDGLTTVYDGPPAGELATPEPESASAEVVEATATENPKPKPKPKPRTRKPKPKTEKPPEDSTSTSGQESVGGVGEGVAPGPTKELAKGNAPQPEDAALEKMADEVDAPF